MSSLALHRPKRSAVTFATLAAMLFAVAPRATHAQADATAIHPPVRVVADSSGSRLQVGGRDFLVRGMNWDYIPIGQNYQFDIFSQPEAVTTAALDREMGLLAAMGVNTIRVGAGIPPRWVRYIHDRYGIYCIINHTVGRYGFTLDGTWNATVDYSNPRTRAALAADVAAAFAPYRGVPGVLMYLLGNENNYGLSWSSFEIEALPKGERDAARAKFLYSLFGEIARATKAQDPDVPVAIANGDLQYIDVIAQECKGIDVFGSNVYRGISAGDLYQRVHDTLGLPFMYTEFGCDAFNARELREDQAMQAHFLIGQWREIYEQTSGHGRVGNAIGGCIFQWSDGWWKFKQTEHLDIHDTNASWPDAGFTDDYQLGENNMNEEWWGICAKGQPNSQGLYDLYPRAAYYAMRHVFALDPYGPGVTDETIRAHFATITPATATLAARGDHAALLSDASERIKLTGARMQFETYSTGGRSVTTPKSAGTGGSTQPAFLGFDQLQSFYADLQAHPSPAVTANLSINALGGVPRNPIDQIFYENRGLARPVRTDSGSVETQLDRVKVYQASISWDDRWFGLEGFYRTGHFHWGYEGDFFGLYREANYGPNIDTYNADAPVGFEVTAKRQFSGLKVAYGPQLWWGANPALLVKYRRGFGRYDWTAVYENDIARQTGFATSSAVSLKPAEKLTLHVKTVRGPFTIEAGGIRGGANRVNAPFQVAVSQGPYPIVRDRIRPSDALGGKLRVTLARGRLQAYAQTASMGLVADAGPTLTTTVTGWNLKDTGSGNQRNVIGGFTYNVGHFAFGPNVLWQKPIVGPMPANAATLASGGRLRNILDDPFAVRANREMTAGEILITYDPSPASWLFAWDNDLREESRFAGSIGFVYRHMPTTMDAAIGVLSDGKTAFAFDNSTPARNLWEINGRAVSRLSASCRIVAHVYGGTGEPNANDVRLVRRYGGDLRIAGGTTALTVFGKFNDWGPYDYHRDFNVTYPMQLMGDLSHTLGAPQWLDSQQTRIGVRYTWRSLDENSARYTERYLDPATNRWIRLGDAPNGDEWELRTYLKLAM